MSLLARVKAGAAYLDAVYGEKWRKKIDVELLDLSEPTSCVLGQTDSDYTSHADALGLNDETAIILGFQLSEEVNSDGPTITRWRRLTDTWKKYLRGDQ